MSQQSPSKGTHTPMGRAEFESHADHGWSPGTLRQWAQRAGLAFDAPAGDLYDALAARSPEGEPDEDWARAERGPFRRGVRGHDRFRHQSGAGFESADRE